MIWRAFFFLILFSTRLAAETLPTVQTTAVAPQAARARPGITLVLAGGGAKGFAHLAVLRRLEQDHIPIAKIIGTSVGAVIGGLYASGMSTTDIERVVAGLEPSRVALDQLDRTELPHRTRAYQQQYPVDVELGVRDGQLTFARGVSDGQRLLNLLQQLTANVTPQSRFDDLRIPFRAVATRYRDGELVAFDHGTLPLVIRASMAAPGVFAPVEIDGETYVDGGLVANLPVEVAIREGADVIVASYLGDTDRPGDHQEAGNALRVANQMLNILMRQNERRNIAMLRPRDILVRPQLQGFGFGSFEESKAIIKVGEKAVAEHDARLRALAQQFAPLATTIATVRPSYSQREIILRSVRVTGNQAVPASYFEEALASLKGREFDAAEVSHQVDRLYASGNFERVSYQVLQLQENQYELVLDVNEKTYGPNYLRTSLGFYSESSGTNLFSVGVGYRRPWITSGGLELNIDLQGGSQSEIAASLYQPLDAHWGIAAHASLSSRELPLYRPDVESAQKMAISTLRRQDLGVELSYDLSRRATVKLGLVTNQTRLSIDTARSLNYTLDNGQTITYLLSDGQWDYTGMNAQFTADVLDSPSFPTRGYYLNVAAAQGVTGSSQYASYRGNALWAGSIGPHVLNLGIDLGSDYILDCGGCNRPTSLGILYLGGFQAMGAYQLGQLSGNRLVHLQSTYMYRLLDGGILRQPTYVGAVLEAGDAWMHTNSPVAKYSGTVFIAVDSKLGDVFFGMASGSGGNRNVFLQLGRRFSLW